MRKIILVFFCLAVVLLFNRPLFSQFTSEEVAERPKWEAFLLEARVVKEEQLSGSEAVTSPWKLALEKDGVTRNALWKNPEGRMKGFVEGWKYEIAAYLLSNHLELNMVPPTVERRFHNNRGSCQLWIEHEMTLKKKTEKNIKTPPLKLMQWNRAVYLQRAFDNLIANEDRHLNNVLITKDWRMILIDHSRSFRTGKKFTQNLIYSEKHPEGPKLMSELPRAFVEKIKALNFELIKSVTGEYLTDDEINAILARKELILKAIDKLIQEKGEDKVLY
ncbi:MAG: hypothetical protein NUW07_04185 [Candidatus Saccharicenans sp.]|jgi:hypothetical protein|nr:hypothetical protein [Candidatus Saccharicenans sp.]MDH7493759.1 hypothetical protein [Candidatus Saccharicenans sp.]